jgi:hypothetical protein
MKARIRLVRPAAHGGNRRGVPYTVDVKAIAEWNAANRAARRAYYECPNACTRAIYARAWR